MRRLLARASIALAGVLGVLAATAPAASALTARWFTDPSRSFSGSACGDQSTVSVRLRTGAFDVTPVRPALGAAFRDVDSGQVVARLTDLKLKQPAGRPTVVFTAMGSDDVCANPSSYDLLGWQTEDTTFRVDYKTHERVYAPGDCIHERYRPRRFVIACGDGNLFVTNLHWSVWRDSAARGRGVAHANDCVPYCAAGHFHSYAVRLQFSRPRYCSTKGRYQFGRVGIVYPGRSPGGPRHYHTKVFCPGAY